MHITATSSSNPEVVSRTWRIEWPFFCSVEISSWLLLNTVASPPMRMMAKFLKTGTSPVHFKTDTIPSQPRGVIASTNTPKSPEGQPSPRNLAYDFAYPARWTVSENNEEITIHRFLIVIEKMGKNFPAYSHGLPDCVAQGSDWAVRMTVNAVTIFFLHKNPELPRSFRFCNTG